LANNTARRIAGVGTLYLNRRVNSKTGVHVYGLELILSGARDGLKKGTALILGSARAGVTTR
jgi:hypothetical protein